MFYGSYGQMPYQTQMQPNQQQIPLQQYQMPIQPVTGLRGKTVDSRTAVEVADPASDCTPSYFPMTDGKTIYVKQLTANGKTVISEYKLTEQTERKEKEYSMLSEKIDNISADITALIDLLGGGKNE